MLSSRSPHTAALLPQEQAWQDVLNFLSVFPPLAGTRPEQ